ncbi:unnamed protein product [Owenia fusiformis]|uniref:Uncharacterized protein n=1 Tax=Owenia fusiformis TaxID=6347 RepID=A0A8J1TCM1_OWEFU|nr:unnamed protein product [Owenia fusiformis]
MPPPTPSCYIDPALEIDSDGDDSDDFISGGAESCDETQLPHATQTESDIISEIRNLCGSATRHEFVKRINDTLDIHSLVSTREALYDYARINRRNAMPPGALLRRLPSRKNKAVSSGVKEKVSNDIYILFQFIEGAANISELKSILNSSSKNRKSTAYKTTSDDNTSVIQPLAPDQLASLLTNVVDFKSFMSDELSGIKSDMTKLAKSNDSKLNLIKSEVTKISKSKESELKKKIDIMTNELNRSRDCEAILKSDLLLAKQTINEQKTEIDNLKKDLKSVNTKVYKSMQTIQNKIHELEKTNRQVNPDVIKPDVIKPVEAMSDVVPATTSYSSVWEPSSPPSSIMASNHLPSPTTDRLTTYSASSEAKTSTNVPSSITSSQNAAPLYTSTQQRPRSTSAVASIIASVASESTGSSSSRLTRSAPQIKSQSHKPWPTVQAAAHAQKQSCATDDASPSTSTYTRNRSYMKASRPGPIPTVIGVHKEVSASIEECDEGFTGVNVRRQRTKKILLSHVKSVPYNALRTHIVKYAARRHVTVTGFKVISRRSSVKGEWLMVRINVLASHYNNATDNSFWPSNITCRPWLSSTDHAKTVANNASTNCDSHDSVHSDDSSSYPYLDNYNNESSRENEAAWGDDEYHDQVYSGSLMHASSLPISIV